jgi:molybdate transport system substrate-binding protein
MNMAMNDSRASIKPKWRRGFSITRTSLGLLNVVFLLSASANVFAASVTVFAAASLTESLKQIGAVYESASGDKVVFNFAASGVLARQIQEGAPADLFFSADEAQADALEGKGLLVKETRKDLLGNSLVIVTTRDRVAVRAPADLTNSVVKRVALGNPRTVPAGAYAKIYLEKTGLWAGVEAKMVPCENVRAVLAAVESGNVDVGVVYKTDAAISRRVKVVFEISGADGPKITYPIALVKEAPQPVAARRFLEYLAGKEAGAVFVREGFVVLSGSAK